MSLRVILATAFLMGSAAAFALAFQARTDPTWLQIWLGVALSALTAGLVDLVATIDTWRREKRLLEQMSPLDRLALLRLRTQKSNIYSLVGVLLGRDATQGDPASIAVRVRNLGDVVVDPAELDDSMFPPVQRGSRAFELATNLRKSQADLENLAAAGIRTDQISAMSKIVTSGFLTTFASGLLVIPGPQRGVGITGGIASQLEELASIDLDDSGSTRPVALGLRIPTMSWRVAGLGLNLALIILILTAR